MLLHYFIAGGIFMWGILLASICGVAVILEKLWIFLTKEKEFTREYRKQLYKALKTESKEEIIKIAKSKRDSVSKIITKAMENIDLDLDKIEESEKEYLEEVIKEAVLGQTGKLEKGMWLLGAVVNTAPQLGLLGTVTGMITSFSALSASAESSKTVADGISEALYTTAFGLIVAIPALIFYNYFNRRIDAVALEMERAALHIMGRVKKKL
ncbi:MotA/TolQ/ExbB proton channel family protein [Leptotrichia shahii]|uniref:MotA/TolQ/ExbB proton channel family protein n=1 Tax=Leptotrichia shahii TaxID=157691 RepID=UPI0028D7869F|nr:MotA/TolQ/ExbB proton channel family protein [Leptotrichia shahii]